MKNFTPLQLTIYTSSFVSLSFLFISIIINSILNVISWGWIFALFVLIFLLSFLSFRYALERFIYRKIKLIYKSIHSLKMRDDSFSKKVDMKENIFDEIKKEVVDWAKNNESEVVQLKENESYRREFLANVSHELKTPIFNIQGYIHTLIDGGLHDSNINLKYLKKAANNLDHLSDIVRDLEVISRLESGQLPIIAEKFDILDLVIEVTESIEIQADKNKINFKIKEGCHKSQMVIADREKIKQVITNLLTNTIRYGNPNGTTLIGIYDMFDNILIEVSDDGIGIAKEHLPHLFDRFYRVDKARSRKEGGSGLGLSIVKHIIEAHGQNINVRSTVGVGSTFGFTLKKV